MFFAQKSRQFMNCPYLEFWPKHLRPTSGGVVKLKTGRRKVPGSNSGRAWRPSRSEFSVVFSDTGVNMGYDPLERPPRRALPL